MKWSKLCCSPGQISQRANTTSLGDAEEVLLQAALIDKSIEDAILSIHRLVEAAVIRRLNKEDQSKYFDVVVRILSWGFPDTWSEDIGHQFQFGRNARNAFLTSITWSNKQSDTESDHRMCSFMESFSYDAAGKWEPHGVFPHQNR